MFKAKAPTVATFIAAYTAAPVLSADYEKAIKY
jgi:hypothetical protein